MELILYSIAFCLFLVSLLVFIIIYSKRVIVNGEVVKKQLEVDHQRELVRQLIDVQEEERGRIARELHDGINAKLATVLLQVSKVDNFEQSQLISGAVKEVMEISRGVAYDLLPPTLESFGIRTAISELFEPVIENSSITIELDLPVEFDELDKVKHLHIYRIVQELLQNSLKHAKARSISLRVIEAEEQFMLTYSDDGIGSDLSAEKSFGLGLNNIKMRAKMIDGKCSFVTSPGTGFRAEIRINCVS